MVSHGKRVIATGIFLLLALTPTIVRADGAHFVEVTVIRVIDGDTLEIPGGRRVRLLGIDAPERGDPLAEQATSRLRDLTDSRTMVMESCDSHDKFGRILATVRVGGINVNETLLREGLALPMLIPPCGSAVSARVLSAAAAGAISGKGIYSLSPYRIISPEEADGHIGEHVMVRGKVLDFKKGKRVWFFNFGLDWENDFTAVAFSDAQVRFLELGIDPAGFRGTEVLVIGKIKYYNGPEIIVHGPGQIIPLEGIMIDDPKSKIQSSQKPD